VVLSELGQTWLIDIDGTIIKHNDDLKTAQLLPKVKEFFDTLQDKDSVVFLTARSKIDYEDIEELLRRNDILYRVVAIICGLPVGERILINDIKPAGLKTSIAINLNRDVGFGVLSE
jgi:hypothetical protein